jgi:hypothetical protein
MGKKLLHLPLRVNTGRKLHTAVNLVHWKEPITHVTVTERLLRYSLLEAKPETVEATRSWGILRMIDSRSPAMDCMEIKSKSCDLIEAAIGKVRRILQSRPEQNRIAHPIEFLHPSDHQLSKFGAPLAADVKRLLKLLRARSRKGAEWGMNVNAL